MTDSPADWAGLDDLDVWTVDRLLDGAGDASDVPAEYQAVTDLIGVIKEGVAPAESGWGSKTVPAMSQLLTAPPREHRRKASRSRSQLRRMPQLAAAVTVVACLGAGSAAAATGSLPQDMQAAVDSAASMLGVSLPNATPGGDADSTAVTTPSSPPVPAGVSGQVPSAGGTASGSIPEGIVNPSRTRRTEVGIGSGVLTARPLPTVTTSTVPDAVSPPVTDAPATDPPSTTTLPPDSTTTTIPPAPDVSTPPTTVPTTGKGVSRKGSPVGPQRRTSS